METLRIRMAEAADYVAMEKIMLEVHALHVGWRPDIYKKTDIVYSSACFEKLVSENRIYVAERNGQVIGHMTFLRRHIESDKQVARNVLYIDDLAVLEDDRGQGIGTALLNAARDLVREERLDGLELQVNARNLPARKMDEKYGFTEKSINLELL